MTDDPQSPVREGDVLAGRYVVERVLAVGGMGTVVAARHAQLGHKVALKFLTIRDPSAKEAAIKESVQRFLVEAKAAARLKSEHVVHVSDVGTLDTGTPYMVMEFLEGSDLGDVLDREGHLPMEVAVEYILQACEGLAEAHAARIVHRDLKPQNLFRSQRPDGSPLIKVLDFGVSKALAEDVRTQGAVTSTDAVFGSPLYMSPEQMVSATRADQRSDLWSMAVVLYELLSGRLPFEAESMAGLCVAIANQPPRKLLGDVPDLPPELEAVLEKCLEKNPDHRYQNVAELATDLSLFAPMHARAHIERIQRLIGGVPPSTPSFSSLSKITSSPQSSRSGRHARPDAETLGPITGSDLMARVRPPKKKWVPYAIAAGGVVLLAGSIFAGITFSSPRQAPTPPPVAATAPPASATASAVVTAPPPATTSVAPAPTPTPRPSVAAIPPTIKKPATAHPTTSSTAAPSASIIMGISHDRK
jgi:serine/threonine-protein kinase